MFKQRTNRLFLLHSSIFALLAFAGTSNAQESASNTEKNKFVFEEIVVTALKREESLQQTAASVSAFTESTLEDVGVHSMRDYAQLVPNLLMVETQGSNFAFINIRGISQFRNTDPSVAVVIDGVLNTTGNGLSQELIDVQQIEVLKGPQGALYGRNAIGGAINITTKKPGNEFEGFVKVGAGNGNSGRVQGSLSGPLVKDELYGRVSFNYYNDDGFRDNVTTGTKGDASQNFSARARVIWEPSDSFSADFRGSYSRDSANAGGFIDVAPIWHETSPGSGISLGQLIGAFPPGSPPAAEDPIFGGASVCLPGNCAELQVPGQAFNVGDFNTTGVPLQVNLNGIDHRDIYNGSILVKKDFEDMTFTSVSSYDRLTQFAVVEQPPRGAGAAQKNNQFRFSEAISQEIRLASSTDDNLQWSVGAYYVHTNTALTSATLRDKDGRDSLRDLVRLDPFAIPDGVCVGNPFPIGGPNDNQGNCLQGFIGDTGSNNAYAIFGELSYDISDELEFTVSGRWDKDERDLTVITPNSLIPQALKDRGAPLNGDVQSASWSSFQPKATLRWTPNDQFMAYATYSEGFRSGGFNQPGITALADFNRPTTTPPIILGIADVFEKQTTSGGEIGGKYTTEDHRLTVNLTGFYTVSKNMPTFTAVTIATNLSQVIIPIDETELYGAELEAAWAVTDELQFTVGLALTESEITKNAADPNLVGNKAPTTPENTINAALNYHKDIELGDISGEFFFRTDYQRIGKIFSVPGNFSERDAVNLVNLRFGFQTVQELRVEFWVKNLFDKDYFAEMFNPAGFGFPAKLRQFGFEVSKKF